MGFSSTYATRAQNDAMMKEMVEAGIEPTIMTYNLLTNQLIIEGKYEEARAVAETEMAAVAVVPDDHTRTLFERPEEVWSKLRATRLQELFKRGTPEARQKAHTFFEQLKASGAACVFHWNVMQQQCNTSAGRRSTMGEMVEAGVQPNAASYNMLTNQLMFEGKYEEARAVRETEMPAAGVMPDSRNHALFEKPEQEWNKMRMTHLRGLLDTSTAEAREQAQAFFEVLKTNNVADLFHWTMMQPQCGTSTEQRGMMGEMVDAGVQPDVSTYTKLAHQLMIEGKYEEARAVVETEMPAAGVVLDDRTHALFEKPAGDWSKMRTQHLQDLLQTNTLEARQQAQAFFAELNVNQTADLFQWGVMQTHCDTSTEQRGMMGEMAEAGVQPTAASYTKLAHQLMIEGKVEEVR